LNIQSLIASGHSLKNIFIDRQKDFPYCGWTFPQYKYWTFVNEEYLKDKKILDITNLTEAIDGSFSKEGRRKLQHKLDRLNAR